MALDRHTVKILREHRRRQARQHAERLAAGKACRDSGYVFARTDGAPLHPGYVSARFRHLVRRTGLPPVRLHDLRHGTASLAHEAGADLKTLQELLGHSSIVVTADTYTSVLPLAQRRCADSTARLVLAAARHTRQRIKKQGRRNRPPTPASKAHTSTRTAPAAVKPQVTTPANGHGPRHRAMPGRHPRDTHRPHRTPNKTA